MHDLANPKSTEVNQTQPEIVDRPLNVVVGKKPKMVDWAIIAKCKDERAAIVLCVNLSNLAHDEIGRQLGIDKGHFSRIMNCRGHFPTHKRSQLMALCENLAPVQFEAMKFGLQMFENQLDREERELEEQLAQVKARKAQMFSPFLRTA